MKTNSCEIIAILDRSGSMGGLVNDVIGGYNQFIKEQKVLPGEAKVTLVLFDNKIEIPYSGMKIQDVPELTKEVYFARGMTSLLDAIGQTFNNVGSRLAATPENERPEKVIVLINTDGEENSSKEFNKAKIKEMIEHQEQKYNWQILFLGANIDSVDTARGLGMSNLAFAANFDASNIGVKAAFSTYSKSSSTLRGGGHVKSMQALYSATLDDLKNS
jgi:uncharacterized protein YegL